MTAPAEKRRLFSLAIGRVLGVEDLMAVLATTRGRRRETRIELALHLGEALEFSHRWKARWRSRGKRYGAGVRSSSGCWPGVFYLPTEEPVQ